MDYNLFADGSILLGYAYKTKLQRANFAQHDI